MTETSSVLIDMEVYYVSDVPWLSGRLFGEKMAQKSQSTDSIENVQPSSRIRMIIPENCGITKSFFEGYLLEFARRSFKDDASLQLAELVSIDPKNVDQTIKGRYNKSIDNLSAALVSLVEYLKQERLLAHVAA